MSTMRILFTALLSVSVGTIGAPAQAQTQGPSYWEARGDYGSATFVPGSSDIWAAQVPERSPAPRVLAIDDWTQCYVFNNSTWNIETFNTTYLGSPKTFNLKCGTASTSGYFHIQNKHEIGWRKRITQAQPLADTETWDDFMWFVSKSVWTNYDYSVHEGNGKLCRSAPIKMYEYNASGIGIYKYTFNPTIVWSLSNNLLVTAYPTSQHNCAK